MLGVLHFPDRDFKRDSVEVIPKYILLGGSWVLISWGLSRVAMIISLLKAPTALLISDHEPPGRRPAPTLTLNSKHA